jgi:hypothetical protein
MMKFKSLPILAGAVALGIGAVFVSPAQATVFDLTSDHCSGAGGCLGGLTSAGTVTVTETGANMLHFAVAPAAGFTIINTGFDGSFAFDLNPNQTVTYSNVTAGFTPVGGNPVGAQNLTQFDGFGSFEYAVLRDTQGGGNGLPSLAFDLTGTSLTLASLQQNSAGTFFVLDVRGTNGNTGLVDASVIPAPPIGHGPLVLLAVGGLLFGAKLFGRSKKHRGTAIPYAVA